MNTDQDHVGSSGGTAESLSTDRELLVLAAKAAGLPDTSKWTYADWDVYGWNPLADDGDALRLAVRLKLRIDRDHCVCCIAVSDGVNVDVLERFESIDEPPTSIQDECAATRRAIVRAAAEVAKATA